jgi:hypothetical protein
MDESFAIPSAYADCMDALRWVYKLPNVPAAAGGKFKQSFVDYVTGVLPAARLLADKKVIVTTPGEAFHEYIKHYDDEYAAWLRTFHPRYAGIEPSAMDHHDLLAEYWRYFGTMKQTTDLVIKAWMK